VLLRTILVGILGVEGVIYIRRIRFMAVSAGVYPAMSRRRNDPVRTDGGIVGMYLCSKRKNENRTCQEEN